MKQKVRKESEVFSNLEKLCASPGYAHIIAFFCFRDNNIKYSDEISKDIILQQYSPERLIRTEISTLIGLACKNSFNTEIPSPETFQRYIDETETLLKEIHQSMMQPTMVSFDDQKTFDNEFNPFKKGLSLREPIFYSGETAYPFQYKNLSIKKYQKDNDWFINNKGYSVQQAISVVSAIAKFQNDKLTNLMRSFPEKDPKEWDFLSAFIFTIEDIATEAKIDNTIAKAVIESFIIPTEIKKYNFSALDDFNPTNAYPIIPLENSEYLLFQYYSLVEALYETPFFWFTDDSSYLDSAMEHRGEFTESFSAERLKLVFGEDKVFTNINIVDSRKTIAGEIDVLVVFANRAIIVQAKSKKLTIEARKGNDNCLQSDFKKAIQNAYDQGYSCANLLENKEYKLVDSEGNELKLLRDYKEIYLFCVLSEHYPALSFQAHQFLKYKKTDKIMPPFVMDVFSLDVMTEMLQSPLYFLSYVNRRTQYDDKIISNKELTILSYHLKTNLYIDNEFMMITDDMCAELDVAMLTRRNNAPGLDTPKGILTRYQGTLFGQIVRDIEELADSHIIDLGFMLLSLDGETIDNINKGIKKIIDMTRKDGKHHDITLGIYDRNTGVTIHCNNDSLPVARSRLACHCNQRKYSLKAKTWFGICIEPEHMRIRFGLALNYDWEQSDEMDEVVKNLPKPQDLNFIKSVTSDTKIRPKKKIGRNEKCPCGSGKKYKKCCL